MQRFNDGRSGLRCPKWLLIQTRKNLRGNLGGPTRDFRFDAAMSRLAQSQSAADARMLAPLLLEQRRSRLAAKMRAAEGWARKQQCGYHLPMREIFFTHTSKETALTRIGSCAVSSAAKVNPDWQVTVLSNWLANPKRRKRTAESFDLFPSWSGHNPPRVVRFEYGRIFASTPFERAGTRKNGSGPSKDSPPRTCRTRSA